MNPPEFILIIILAGMGLSAWKMKHGYGRFGRRNRGRDYDRDEIESRAQTSAREAELQREVEDLRERVKVLERIATDDRGSRMLADEIEKLRDK